MVTRHIHPTIGPGETTIVITETHVNAALLMIGRLVFGGYWVFAGLNHWLHVGAMAVYTGAHGVPEPALAVVGTGALLVAGGLSILTGVMPKLGATFIAIFLIGVTPIMHAFWRDITPAEHAADLANFMKNVALLGATAFVASLDMTPGVVLRKA